jgi:hypothetical protein
LAFSSNPLTRTALFFFSFLFFFFGRFFEQVAIKAMNLAGKSLQAYAGLATEIRYGHLLSFAIIATVGLTGFSFSHFSHFRRSPFAHSLLENVRHPNLLCRLAVFQDRASLQVCFAYEVKDLGSLEGALTGQQ